MNNKVFLSFLIFTVAVIFVSTSPVQVNNSNVRNRRKKFTVQELMNTTFPHLVSDDIHMDPCKSDDFYGDIALPDSQLELEWERLRNNKTFKKAVEQIKEEILLEGLQVEEEGLIEIQVARQREIMARRKKGEDEGLNENKTINSVPEVKPLSRKRRNTLKRSHLQSSQSNSIENLIEEDQLDEGKFRKPHKILKMHKKKLKFQKRLNMFLAEAEILEDIYTQEEKRKSREETNATPSTYYENKTDIMTDDVTESYAEVIPSLRRKRAATARKERIWENGIIPYEIDDNFNGADKALFKQAMRHWENFTCIQFVERVPYEHPNYIVFTERPCGCCSFVGKRGNGAQAISIGKNCNKFGIIVHELGHVIGFWHEHTRPDRDHHVQIIRENIMSGQEYNFNQLTEDEVHSLGLPYDYDSIMHYARNTFSKGTYLDTILPKDTGERKRPEIGQRIRLSEGDIAQTNLLYKCSRCGRTHQENSAMVASFDYPITKMYLIGERCEWRITATNGERIILNITDMDIFDIDRNCTGNYLEIRDGYWNRSELIGRFCNANMATKPIVSTSSRLLISYVTSNEQIGHRGFNLFYEAVCGGEIYIDDTGHLESPNYPEDYQPNKQCIWKITAPENFQIALKFQSFEIENHDSCFYDYLEILDGHTLDSPSIGKYCGYKIPTDIVSTSNKLLMKFVSDGSVQKAGFSVVIIKENDECASGDHGCEHKCVNTLGNFECGCNIGFELHSDGKHCEDACGGVLDAMNGTIMSPSFPEVYPASKTCVWEIVAPPQYQITLNFTHFDLEGNNMFQEECEYDSVQVYSKMNDNNLARHGTYCGSRLPPVVTSRGNILRIEFMSDISIQKSGFAAIFFTDMDECAVNNGGCQHECHNTLGSFACSCRNGFILHENKRDCKESGCKHEITSPVGSLTSPNYPGNYPSRKECVWHFTTSPGHRIKLVFNNFEMEPHQECAYDHIALYDGLSTESHTFGKFCGSKVPHPIISSGNKMLLVFKSDASVQRKGFSATHMTVCGGHLTATNTLNYIHSHAKYGDYNYDSGAECDWTIEAPPGKNVHLTFLSFYVEDESECNYDYVEILSGIDGSGPSFGRFCGNQNPSDIISMNEALLLRFHSDDSVTNKGFSLAYRAVDRIHNDDDSEADEEYGDSY